MTDPREACGYNFVDTPTTPERAPAICDVTLRDGEQTIDAAFEIDEKVAVIERLQDAGVERVQVGFAGSGADREAVVRAKRGGASVPLELILMGLGDGWSDEVSRAIDSGVDAVQVFVRASTPILDAMGVSQDFVVDRIAAIVELARSTPGVTVAAGPSFATSTALDFLDRIYDAASAQGAHELVINDTLGVARPSGMASLVRHLGDRYTAPVRVHCHNDFGLATANALASWEAGAALVDVAVNGLGERAGNVPLDEFAMALDRLYDRPSSVRTPVLTGLAEFLGELLRTPVPVNKPVVGANAFAQLTEMHVRIAKDRPELFEPYDPALVGGRREIRLGKGSGPLAVAAKLETLDATVPESELDAVVAEVNRVANDRKRALDDDDIRELAGRHR